LDRLGQDWVCDFAIFFLGIFFGLLFGFFLFWLFFACSSFLFGILLNRILFFQLLSNGFGDIKQLNVLFELIVLNFVSVMKLKLQAS
jgi:hypothetical protein